MPLSLSFGACNKINIPPLQLLFGRLRLLSLSGSMCCMCVCKTSECYAIESERIQRNGKLRKERKDSYAVESVLVPHMLSDETNVFDGMFHLDGQGRRWLMDGRRRPLFDAAVTATASTVLLAAAVLSRCHGGR